MREVSLIIDGQRINASGGEKVLWAALDNKIYIPHLCAIREAEEPAASCRLCFVEVEGYPWPVTACTEPVREGMVVYTRGPKALKLARTPLELLLSNHPVDCTHCPANRSCELQRIAHHLGVKLISKKFRSLPQEIPVDDSSPLFTYDPNKCVLCGRCVWVCQKSGTGVLGFAYRGFRRRVTVFGDEPLGSSACSQCEECVRACPVGALAFKT